jgi:hypothetical protein
MERDAGHAAVIKVVHNSGQQRYYEMELKEKNIHICVHVQVVPADLDYMANLIHNELVFKKKYTSITFNYKSVSDMVRNYYPFREKMIKMLQKKDPDTDFDALLEIVRIHMQKGKHPNFHAYEDPKKFKKIANYINSVTGLKVSNSVVQEICKKIITFVE